MKALLRSGDHDTCHFRYAPILMQPAIKAIAALWYCIYVGFAIYGCMHLREGLEPVNLLVRLFFTLIAQQRLS